VENGLKNFGEAEILPRPPLMVSVRMKLNASHAQELEGAEISVTMLQQGTRSVSRGSSGSGSCRSVTGVRIWTTRSRIYATVVTWTCWLNSGIFIENGIPEGRASFGQDFTGEGTDALGMETHVAGNVTLNRFCSCCSSHIAPAIRRVLFRPRHKDDSPSMLLHVQLLPF
jgi:hypothetical protein